MLVAFMNNRAADALSTELTASIGRLPILSETRPVRRAENVKMSAHADPIRPISIQLAPMFEASSGEMGTPMPIANISRNVNAYWSVPRAITDSLGIDTEEFTDSA